MVFAINYPHDKGEIKTTIITNRASIDFFLCTCLVKGDTSRKKSLSSSLRGRSQCGSGGENWGYMQYPQRSLYLHKLRTKVAPWIKRVHESMHCWLNQVQLFTGQESLHLLSVQWGRGTRSHCFLTCSWYWDLHCHLSHSRHWVPTSGDSISKIVTKSYSYIFRITNIMGLCLLMSLKVCQEHKSKTIQKKQFHEGSKPWSPGMQLVVVCLYKS